MDTDRKIKKVLCSQPLSSIIRSLASLIPYVVLIFFMLGDIALCNCISGLCFCVVSLDAAKIRKNAIYDIACAVCGIAYAVLVVTYPQWLLTDFCFFSILVLFFRDLIWALHERIRHSVN